MQENAQNKGLKLFIIILIGIILLFSKEENQKKAIKFIEDIKISKKNLKVIESIPINEGIDDIFFYEKGIMVWKDKKLTRLNIDGSKEWEKEFNIDNPKISFGEENIYVYEKPTGNIYFLNAMGETVHRIELKAKINNVVENFRNLLVHIKKENIESINILDKKGKIIVNSLIKDGNILTYAMDKDNKNYVISILNLKDKKLKSEIHVFEMGGKSLFNIEIQDEIILYSSFIDSDKIITMTDKGLYLINDGNILWKKQFQLIKDICINNDKINILFGNTLETISIDGRVEEKHSFSEEYKKIFIYDKYLVVYGDEYIIGLKNGKEVFKYKSEERIHKVIQGEQKLILVYENKIQLMSL
ncbi:TPA: DUF5711 family protein [Clostridioides difficile]|jgi:hypothetical protein